MLADVFYEVIFWFYLIFEFFLNEGGYIGMAIVIFPILRKVCFLFKQFTN